MIQCKKVIRERSVWCIFEIQHTENKMNNKEIPYKIYLEENEMPRQWYNVRADMKKKPAPLLNAETKQPITVDELSKVNVVRALR